MSGDLLSSSIQNSSNWLIFLYESVALTPHAVYVMLDKQSSMFTSQHGISETVLIMVDLEGFSFFKTTKTFTVFGCLLLLNWLKIKWWIPCVYKELLHKHNEVALTEGS